jgi:hypothetical protein
VQLSPEERAELEREAIAAGLDPAAVVAEAENAPEPAPAETGGAANDGDEAEPSTSGKQGAAKLGVGPDGQPRVFAYNMGLLTATQYCAFMGFPPPREDGDLFVLEFLAKHDGSKFRTSASPATPGGPPPPEPAE